DQVLAALRQQWDRRPITGNWTDRGMVPPAGAAGQEDADDSDRAVATFVFGSDLHCNIGMARGVGEVAGMGGADASLDGRDDELPEEMPRVLVKGNHDSTETTQHAKTRGWEVLEDSTAEMAGVTFFGAADPRRTVFGSGAQLETELTADQYAQRLRD